MRRYFIFLLLALYSCQPHAVTQSEQASEYQQLIIFYTNDEHGWMEPHPDGGGAAALRAAWSETSGTGVDLSNCLILSGGDMWTGPAISTLSAGQSMVDIMNTIGYQAAALGNHEFDFGLENLRSRVAEMNFPLLAANLRETDNDQMPDFVLPYTIIDINKVSVGILGLASIHTPSATKQASVAGLAFDGYAGALQAYIPQLRAAGAELVIVIGHICLDEMEELAPLASELGVKLIGGGHCHQHYHTEKAGVSLIQSGSKWENYIQVNILFDDRADTVVSLKTTTHQNSSVAADKKTAERVAVWRKTLDLTLGEVIGYAETAIKLNSPELGNMITDSWLYAFPDAQIALTNPGGIRQSIPAGDITIETINGLLPFENNILMLTLKGSELTDCLFPKAVAAGFLSIDRQILTDDRPLAADSVYRVLINDFMYLHPDMNFSRYDTHPYDTQTNYRQPMIDWLKTIRSSKSDPLNNYLDQRKR